MYHRLTMLKYSGTAWEREIKVEAQTALRLFYGLQTATQEEKALQRALQQLNNKYGRNIIRRV